MKKVQKRERKGGEEEGREVGKEGKERQKK